MDWPDDSCFSLSFLIKSPAVFDTQRFGRSSLTGGNDGTVTKTGKGETTMSEETRKMELRKPISKQELERRFKAVREAMEKEKLDCLVERPSVRPEEDMMVKADMNITIHPMTMDSAKNASAFCCDNFIITSSGAVRIHTTPRDVFVV
jgi:hypothetical protein